LKSASKYSYIFLKSIFFATLLSSCIDGSVYENNHPVDPSGWNIRDSVEFAVDISDTVTPVNFMLNIRHTIDYEYSNIYIFVNTVYPSKQYSRDTIEILLAGKDGKWFGKGMGKLKEVQVMLKDGVLFPMNGVYRFSFVQAMRVETLKGIEDIGIRIEMVK